ncbi:hypothetical protein [Paenibacillus methanolicus]|nr:hypothetical protein [Paenibacillus methanolicus]
MPDTLRRLHELDKTLMDRHGADFDELFGACLYFAEDDDVTYDCTPEDAIVFLATGANGDHFAFLTEGDTVDSLENAPVVFIQPMESDDPIKPVARNIKEFLALYVQLKELYLFEWLPSYESEEAFLSDYENSFAEALRADEERTAIITAAIEQAIELPKIEHVYAYIQEMKLAFQKRQQALK